MAFIKEAFLIKMERDTTLEAVTKKYFVPTKEEATLTIFLCHSHKDKQLAIGFKRWLAQLLEKEKVDVRIYIDWQDSSLPDKPNKETAEHIRNKIKELDLFIFLATNNALSSKWCPWEIGLADGLKDYENILIVPIVYLYDEEFQGSEYLQLYKRLEITGDNKMFILFPEFEEYGTRMESFRIPFEKGESLISFIEKIIEKK